MIREALWVEIDRDAARWARMSDRIFDRPELGREERFASALLTEELERLGFAVERGVGGIETAFRAVWENGAGGPALGLLCEYDALRGMGHGCAHHMQGPAVLAAAAALKSCPPAASFRLVVYGTPDEEYGNGKLTMLRNGCFAELDVALMTHGGPNTTVDVKSMAERIYDARFYGQAAHAAIRPEDGRSALDALLLAFQGTEFLREHVPDDVRMHYTMREAGAAVNVVPAFAAGTFVLRSYSAACLARVCARFEDVVRGAALMTGTRSELELVTCSENKIPVLTLNELLMEHARALGAPQISPPREKTGSTDFGAVMHRSPGSCIRVAFVPEGTSSHSQAFLDAGKSEALHGALLLAAKVLAATVADLAEKPQLLEAIRREFRDRLAEET
ncbi:MAG TPA: M20 family metallopeptidase [Clostridia bacterium]|nr:M20 family metallopeptidase [Clostridia bacterium]